MDEKFEDKIDFDGIFDSQMESMFVDVPNEDEIPAREINEIIGLPNIDSLPEKRRGRKPKLKEEKEEEESDNFDSGNLYEDFIKYIKLKTNIDEGSEVKELVPTGIQLLDAILGGGFAVGTMPVITGPPGCGKSSLASQVIANAQKVFGDKILAVYMDSENAITTHRLISLGVNNPPIKPLTNLTIEKVFRVLHGMCLFKIEKKITDIPSVIVWDSLANTLSEKEFEISEPNKVIGYKGRILSMLIPKYLDYCYKYKILFIVVNQLRDVVQIGPYPKPRDLRFLAAGKEMPGGTAFKYNAFHLLELSINNVINSDVYGFDGLEIVAKCSKNKLFTLNIKVPLIFDHNCGFSDFWTNFNFLKLTKRIVTGSWNYLITMPDIKFRSRDAYKNYLDKEEFRNEFDKAVRETIKTEIIDKYSISKE